MIDETQPKERLPHQPKPTQENAIRSNFSLDMTNDIKLGRKTAPPK